MKISKKLSLILILLFLLITTQISCDSKEQVTEPSAETQSELESSISQFQFPLKGDCAPIALDFNVWNGDWYGYHLGQDILREPETPVYPIAKGEVKFAQYLPDLGLKGGYVVIIEHKFLSSDQKEELVTSVYYHMRKPKDNEILKPGDTVLPDKPIGYISEKPEDHMSIPHLHFGIRKGGYSPGTDTRTNVWFYPGYTTIYPSVEAKEANQPENNPNNPIHQEIVSEWVKPSDFIEANYKRGEEYKGQEEIIEEIPCEFLEGLDQKTIDLIVELAKSQIDRKEGSGPFEGLVWADSEYTYCDRFVSAVMTVASGKPLYERKGYLTAFDDYSAHEGLIKSGEPPKGAVVYYGPTPYNSMGGHVGISDGEGNIISVVDITNGVKISSLTADFKAPLLGWITYKEYESQGEVVDEEVEESSKEKVAEIENSNEDEEKEKLSQQINTKLKSYSYTDSFPLPPISQTLRIIEPDLVERVESIYFTALDYQFYSLRSLRFARGFLNEGEVAKSKKYIEKADRYYKLATSLLRDSFSVLDNTYSAAQWKAIYIASRTALGFTTTGLGIKASTLYDIGTLYTDYLLDTSTTSIEESNKNLIVNAISIVLLRSTGASDLVGDTVKYGWGSSQAFPVLQKIMGSSEFKDMVLKEFMRLGGDVGDYAAKKTIEEVLEKIIKVSFDVIEEDLIKPNTSPSEPAILAQFKSDGKTTIGTGNETGEPTVIFKAKIDDPDNDKVKLQIELRRLNEYEGKFDETKGELKESGFVNSGTEASVTVTVYDLINGSYHWRARTIDNNGNRSNWVDFGNNLLLDTDFIVYEEKEAEEETSEEVIYEEVEELEEVAEALLLIETTSLLSGTVDVSYNFNLLASGGKTPYSWSIVSGNMPSGLKLNTSGIISGTPKT